MDAHGTLPDGGGLPEAAAAFEDRIYDYRFTVDTAELARLDARPAWYDEQRLFIPARLTVDGRDVGLVGLRYKGHAGTFHTCLSDDGRGPAVPYKPNPANGCPPVPKFSYKVLFDAVVPATRFHGLARMNLHNLIRDPSKLHERMAYQLYRDMGIATARSTFARVTVNGQLKGLYAATEDINDRRFIRDRWPSDSKGNLYKQGWPVTVDPGYWRDSLANPRPKPRSRSQRPGRPVNHGKMLAFSRDVLAAKGDPDRVAAALARWSDPDWLARYMAVDTAVRNVDGVTKLFCKAGQPDCRPHNFFWYQTRRGKFLLLPWDLDYTFRVSVRQNRLPLWDQPLPVPGIAGCDARIAMDSSQHAPPSCDPLLKGINARRPLYIRAVKRLLALPSFHAQSMIANVDRWSAMIGDLVAADPAIPKSGPKEWKAQIALLKHDIRVLRARMEAVAAGQAYRPFPPAGEWQYPPPGSPPAPTPSPTSAAAR